MARALLRPDLRRHVHPARRRAVRRPQHRGVPDLRRVVRADLVDMDRVHLLQQSLRRRRRRPPHPGVRADVRHRRPGGLRSRGVRRRPVSLLGVVRVRPRDHGDLVRPGLVPARAGAGLHRAVHRGLQPGRSRLGDRGLPALTLGLPVLGPRHGDRPRDGAVPSRPRDGGSLPGRRVAHVRALRAADHHRARGVLREGAVLGRREGRRRAVRPDGGHRARDHLCAVVDLLRRRGGLAHQAAAAGRLLVGVLPPSAHDGGGGGGRGRQEGDVLRAVRAGGRRLPVDPGGHVRGRLVGRRRDRRGHRAAPVRAVPTERASRRGRRAPSWCCCSRPRAPTCRRGCSWAWWPWWRWVRCSSTSAWHR